MSQALNRLGIKISLVEMMDSILFREEDELVELLEENLSNDIDILEGDAILLALDRTPNISNLNLEEIGVKFNRKGIEVNEYLETSVKDIYAVGDVVGPYQFSHMANVQGIAAVQNAVLPINRKIDYLHVAWCTFSEPELARARFTEKEARDKYKGKIRIYRETYENLDRAKTNKSKQSAMF